MGYYNKLMNLNVIRDAMQDEESRAIFDAMIDYMVTQDKESYLEVIQKFFRDWNCDEVKEKIENVKGIIIFGCGHDGVITKKILTNCNYCPEAFCDNNNRNIGKVIEGIPVISVQSVIDKKRDYLVVLASRKYVDEMYRELKERGFPEENILRPRLGIVVATTGNQYFDVFDAGKEEVFIDAGSWNGDTTQQFINWAGGANNYKKIFIFEPLEEMYKQIEERVKRNGWKNISLHNCAVWNQEEELAFIEDTTGSKIGEKGTMRIKGVDIDNVIGQQSVTFIKLDIEGTELKALEGARNTILRNKPKLAISVYHKPYDIVDLAHFILALVPEYKLYLRHYTSERWETVLYAAI